MGRKYVFFNDSLLFRRHYTVIAPKVVRPNSEYHVAVSTTGVSTPSTISVELDGELDNGDAFQVSQENVVEPYVTRIFKLEAISCSDTIHHKFSINLFSKMKFNTSKIKKNHKFQNDDLFLFVKILTFFSKKNRVFIKKKNSKKKNFEFFFEKYRKTWIFFFEKDRKFGNFLMQKMFI